MRHFEIVMTLIEQGSVYHFQLRNGATQKGGLNKVGCFGGAIEDGETPLDAACRETTEESSLATKPEELELIGEVNVNSDREGQQITVHSFIYRLKLAPTVKLSAREGELVTIPKAEVYQHLDRFTPGTRACFEELIPQE